MQCAPRLLRLVRLCGRVEDGRLHRGGEPYDGLPLHGPLSGHRRGSLPGRDTIGHGCADAYIRTPRGLVQALRGSLSVWTNGAPTARRVIPPSQRTPRQASIVEEFWDRSVPYWDLLPHWRAWGLVCCLVERPRTISTP
jgi:hypothetical protein